MLKILVDHFEFYIMPSESLSLELPTGYFDSSGIPSARILPFNAPVKGNEEIFGHLHLSYVQKNIIRLACQIAFMGISIRSGKLYITKTSSYNYRLSIIMNGFSEEFNSKALSDLVLEPVELTATAPDHFGVVNHATNTANGIITPPYRFPMVAAPKFYGSVDEDLDESENNLSYGQQETDIEGRFFNLVTPLVFNYWHNSISTSGTTRNPACLVPFFQLSWVLKKIFESEYYQVGGAFLKDDAIAKLLIMNNRTLDKMYVMYQAQIRRSTEALFQGVVSFTEDEEDPNNVYDMVNHQYKAAYNGIHEVSFSIEHKHQGIGALQRYPEVHFYIYKNGVEVWHYTNYSDPAAYSTQKATATFNLVASDKLELRALATYEEEESGGSGDWHTIEEEIYLRKGLISYRNMSYSALNQYQQYIYPEQHLPDMEVSKFFTSLKQIFGLVFLFDNKKKVAEIEFFDNIIKGKTIDITGIVEDDSLEEEYQEDEGFELKFKAENIKDISGFLEIDPVATKADLPIPAELNQAALVLNENAWYIYAIDADDDFQLPYWKFHSDRLENYKQGHGQLKVSPMLAPASMTMEGKYLVPRYDGEASSPAFNMDVNPMSLRLLFDYGKKTISFEGENYQYPFASSQNLDVDGANLENMSLQWPELYEKHLKNQLAYTTAGIKATCRLAVDETSFLILLKLLMPRVSNPDNYRFVAINQVKFLPEVFTFVFAGHSIKDAQLKMRRRMD